MKPGTKEYRDRETVAEAYRRILKAAESGRGCRLTAEECRLIQFDDAVSYNVTTFDHEIKQPT